MILGFRVRQWIFISCFRFVISCFTVIPLMLSFIGGVPGENDWPAASHWQTLSHNVILSTPHLNGIEVTMLVMIGKDCIGSCISNYYAITTTSAPTDNYSWLISDTQLSHFPCFWCIMPGMITGGFQPGYARVNSSTSYNCLPCIWLGGVGLKTSCQVKIPEENNATCLLYKVALLTIDRQPCEIQTS